MHRDFMELALSNGLTVPGGARMLGSDIDLGKVDTDTYVVAGIADHLCQWESCYRTTQLLGGDTRFILSTSGHIASMVNPPGNPKASYQTAPENPPEAADWLESATKVRGSWWEDYVALARRAHRPGAQAAAQARICGSCTHLRCARHLCPRPLSGTACARSRCAGTRCGSRCAGAAGRSRPRHRCCCATASGPASRRSSRWSTTWTPTGR